MRMLSPKRVMLALAGSFASVASRFTVGASNTRSILVSATSAIVLASPRLGREVCVTTVTIVTKPCGCIFWDHDCLSHDRHRDGVDGQQRDDSDASDKKIPTQSACD